MSINLLDQNTINKIAAGEVVDRPSSVVKELVENAIDAKATAITVEIKDGGTSLIRITDNGIGIDKDDIKVAFLRHSTSKIKSAADLVSISSLGFRGEALSSISAVSQVELITKTKDSLTGIRYQIDGGAEKAFEEVGAPDGTTFLIRNLFYNTPARRKFLKSPATEAGYISALIENLCLSHPDISIRFINNNQPKLQTAGNGKIKDVIYAIYGREITNNLLEINREFEDFTIKGFVGKPLISRGNRNFENYYINGRYVKSNIIAKAIEDAYAGFIMQHKYPFVALHMDIKPELLDVNVHPSKMELRFSKEQETYNNVKQAVLDALNHKELIPEVSIEAPKNTTPTPITPVDYKAPSYAPRPVPSYNFTKPQPKSAPIKEEPAKYIAKPINKPIVNTRMPEPFEAKRSAVYAEAIKKEEPEKLPEQLELFDKKELLKEENKKDIKIIGQLFDTYWIIQFENNMYMIDQHAAHEKVLYEEFKKNYDERKISTQQLSPPVIFSLTLEEQNIYKKNASYFSDFGYEIEEFGGDEFAIRGIPADFSESDPKEILIEILDSFTDDFHKATPETIKDRIATMSCKAAVKGNNKLSYKEAEILINQLMNLENPYNCPHGRPTMITMSKYEIEKKFKRII